MSDSYSGPARLVLPDDDGVHALEVTAHLSVDPVLGEWRGSVRAAAPIPLTGERVEMQIPGCRPAPAILMEGAGVEIYGQGPPPWRRG